METPNSPTGPGGHEGKASETSRVLIIDHYHDRRQLMSYVAELCGVTVVGFAGGPAEAAAAVVRCEANVTLIEMQFPNAVETIRALRADHPSLRIVVCSFDRNPQSKKDALSAGADVYLTKPIGPRDLQPHLKTPPPSPQGGIAEGETATSLSMASEPG